MGHRGELRGGKAAWQSFRHVSCTTPALAKPMADKDFFAFCTSLKPIELKAMGELSGLSTSTKATSCIRPTILATRFNIINRGVVERYRTRRSAAGRALDFSRGDIFGDCEALCESPRTHLMRAREKASLQCIQCQDFGELSRRVPSFFRYLSEQLAARLLHSTELSLSKSHCLELSGSLSNFDLVTIYQTIRNSVQTGELAISDESGQLMASFFFKEGHPHSGQFQHLTGNEALWELFLARRWLEHFRSRPAINP